MFGEKKFDLLDLCFNFTKSFLFPLCTWPF